MHLSPSLSIACLGVFVALVSAMHGARPDRELRLARHSTTFFACEPEFAYEASGDAARCRRPASVAVTAMTDCQQLGGVAMVERVDLVGTKDMCASARPGVDVSVERGCPANYTKRVVSGPDRCELPTPEMIRAPSVPVAR